MTTFNDELSIARFERECAAKVADIVAMTGRSASSVHIEMLRRVSAVKFFEGESAQLSRRYVILEYMHNVALVESGNETPRAQEERLRGMVDALRDAYSATSATRRAVEELIKKLDDRSSS